MKAIVRTAPGKFFSGMKVMDVSSEPIGKSDLRIKMIASRINPVDMDLMKGFPTLKYKTPQFGGIDGVGEIVELGEGVERFNVGDSVAFYRLFTDIGTWAEEIVVDERFTALVPDRLDLLKVGSIVLPLLTAYESLMALKPEKGATILVHGAGGGVGFQAVHLARALGLEVIANASERDKKDLMNAGIKEFIDYRQTNFADYLSDRSPDYVLDTIGKKTLTRSIFLQPEKVVSTNFPAVDQMNKTGVKLSGFLKFVIGVVNMKHNRMAKKNNVSLIGQVTGANRHHLKSALDLISSDENYFFRETKQLSLAEVSERGLSEKSIGKTIVFNENK